MRRYSKTLGLSVFSPAVDTTDCTKSLTNELPSPSKIQLLISAQDTEEGNSPVFTQTEHSVLEFFKLLRKRDARDLPLLKRLIENDVLRKTKGKINPGEMIVNAKDAKGYTPIMIAAEIGSFEIVRLLLENGADWSIKSGAEKSSCLEVAAGWGHVQVVKLLMKQPWRREEMVQAVMTSDSWEIIRFIKMQMQKRRCSLALI
jgi:hypothetical protein